MEIARPWLLALVTIVRTSGHAISLNCMCAMETAPPVGLAPVISNACVPVSVLQAALVSSSAYLFSDKLSIFSAFQVHHASETELVKEWEAETAVAVRSLLQVHLRRVPLLIPSLQ